MNISVLKVWFFSCRIMILCCCGNRWWPTFILCCESRRQKETVDSCEVKFCSNDLVLVLLYVTKQTWQKQLYNLNKLSREKCAPSISERLRVTFISDTEVDQTRRREELQWIETRERRERKTVRGRATAPNLNKTNEYITGLFYLSPNGFTPESNSSLEPDTGNMEGEEETWWWRTGRGASVSVPWPWPSAARELQTLSDRLAHSVSLFKCPFVIQLKLVHIIRTQHTF